MTSNANDLTERLRRRLESERQAIEELTASELERLGANSRRVARNALRIIERDTAVATGRMRALLLNAWLRPLVVGLSLWLGICGGSWATMHWLSDAHPGPDRDGRRPRPGHRGGTPDPGAAREATTWGITLREIEGERFVVLPAGTLAYPPWTVRDRPAVKLSRE